jgi:hypothetical protein
MKRRVFTLNIPRDLVDYRDDILLLSAIEVEVRLARRFFDIVEFIDANPDDASKADRELVAELGSGHWRRAKKILENRRRLLNSYGPLPSSVIYDKSENEKHTRLEHDRSEYNEPELEHDRPESDETDK